ncbi:MAG: DUF4097 family beta strand repeat-containing protein, partial [Lysobacteraceae bacterium]
HSLLLILALALPTVALASTPISEVRALSPQGMVSIDNTKGAVVVRVSTKPEVRIEGAVGEGVLRVAIEGDHNNLHIRVVNPDAKGWFGNWGGNKSGETRLEITIPASASVSVEGVSAANDIQGVAGRRLSVDTVSGNIDVAGAPDEAQIKSVSGDLRLNLQTNKVHAETVNGNLDLRGRLNGDITIGTVSGRMLLDAESPSELEVSAVSGNVELHTGIAQRGQIKAESTTGDIKLVLPAASSAQLELNSYSGQVQSDTGTVAKAETGTGATLNTRIGKGEANISVESFSGDLSLNLE